MEVLEEILDLFAFLFLNNSFAVSCNEGVYEWDHAILIILLAVETLYSLDLEVLVVSHEICFGLI